MTIIMPVLTGGGPPLLMSYIFYIITKFLILPLAVGAVHLLRHTFWPLLDPHPPLSYCVIVWLSSPTPLHVWDNKWIRYVLERIIFGLSFKGVEEVLNYYALWNPSLFIKIHNKIVLLLYFQGLRLFMCFYLHIVCYVESC